jgi:DNA (cytosine-5)-methyltransferase 1
MKPRALDLFCSAGGATRGLQLAGFHVTGVDIKAQPRYVGDAFIQGDALEADLDGYDFIWASPPCQAFTTLRHMPTAHHKHPNLIPQTRRKLVASGIPWCIENVPGAPLGKSGNLITLCGSMFGLMTADGRAELRRHRLFESSFPLHLGALKCQHGTSRYGSLTIAGEYAEINSLRKDARATLSIYGGHARDWAVLTVTGHTPVDNRRVRDAEERRYRDTVYGEETPKRGGGHDRLRQKFTVNDAREAMGIDWMTMAGLSQAIPPAYAEFIGEQAMAALSLERAA